MKSASTLPLALHQRDDPFARASANVSIRFQGELSVTVLRRAVAFIMRRHEALRVRFVRCDGQLRQCFVEPVGVYDLPVVCLANLEAAEQRIKECMRISTNLETDGPLRAELLRLREGDHILLFLIHSHVIDDFSVRLLTRELLFSYECYLRDQDPLLPSAMRYSDYILSEIQCNEGLSDDQLRHWRSVVNGSRDPIPRQESRPGRTAARFRYLSSSITSVETDYLRQFAVAVNVSMVAVLYAVILISISSRYSDEDIIATVLYSGRDSRAEQILCAKATRLFPVRLTVGGSVSLVALVRNVQAAFMQGALASRAASFTSAHVAGRVLDQLRSAESGAQWKEKVRRRDQMIIIDHSYSQREIGLVAPGLSAERVILDPRAYDSPEIDPEESSDSSPFGDGSFYVFLRRDLVVEPGRPVTFVGAFYTHAISEREAALLLERMCDIARLVGRGDPNWLIGDLVSRVSEYSAM